MPPLVRFFVSPRWKKQLLVECAITLLLVKIALVVVSYRGLKQRCTGIKTIPEGRRRSPREIAAAICTIAPFVPGATCLPQAIAGQIVMARHGQASTIRLGVAPEQTKFLAHAWLVQGERVVLGGSSAQLSEYRVLTDLGPVA